MTTKLRRQDYAHAYTILERCRACGDDPYLWRLRLVNELVDLFGCATAYIGDHRIVGPVGGDGWIVPYSLVDYGDTTEQQRAAFWKWIATCRPEQNPMVKQLMKPKYFQAKRLNVMLRCPTVDDATWYASDFYQIYCRSAGLDDMLGASFRTAAEDVYWIVVHRAKGDDRFNQRDRRTLAIITHVIVNEIGQSLASSECDSMLQIPRRQRETLLRLLAGDSEKQAAAALGVSPHTVHTYIRSMYREFNVNSRSELIARARCLMPALTDSLLDRVPLDHDQRLSQAMKVWDERFGAKIKNRQRKS